MKDHGRIEKGCRATIIGGTDGVNVGKIVEVGEFMGEHSKYGRIWHVRSLGLPLVTEYGAVGPECDCAEAWLRRLPPTEGLQAANDELYAPDPELVAKAA